MGVVVDAFLAFLVGVEGISLDLRLADDGELDGAVLVGLGGIDGLFMIGFWSISNVFIGDGASGVVRDY